MQGYKILIMMLMLTYTVSAEDLSVVDNYELDVDIRLDRLFGECPMFLQAGNDSLDGQFLNDTGTCIINFFNPAIPSPFEILDTLMGEKLQNKIDYIIGESTEISILGLLSRFFLAPLRVINMMVYTVLELVVSVLNFMIAFGGRFIFTYLFYVSLGFNTVLAKIDQNRKLSDLDKMYTTMFMIVVATIYTLAGGWAWI